MERLIAKITSNIGKKLKEFFLSVYIVECIAGFVAAIIGFVWQSGEGSVALALLCLVGGAVVPFVLYPLFMCFYGYAIIVHKMESDSDNNAGEAAVSESAESAEAHKEEQIIASDEADEAKALDFDSNDSVRKSATKAYKLAYYIKTHPVEVVVIVVAILIFIGVFASLF